MSEVRVAVIGGGLAGITAALDCADAGAAVTLFESRSRLGGATFSVRRNGYWIDNGQHVALRCCTAYRSLLDRLGVSAELELQPRLSVPVLAPDGRSALLARTSLPAPLHLAASLLSYRHLSPVERLSAARAVTHLRRLEPSDAELDQHLFGDWLRAHGQTERAIRSLWNLITLPTLNIPADQASLQLAAFVFRTGLLDQSDAGDLAIPRVPLRRLHGNPAGDALRRRNVSIELRAGVRHVLPTAGRFEILVGDRVFDFDRVVCAVPHHAAAALLPDGLVDRSSMDRLGASPIVNVHLHYDRPVVATAVAAAVDSPLQWIFDRSEAAGIERGQLLSLSISNATRETALQHDDLVRRCATALAELVPRARHAALLDATVIREPRATFRGAPGSAHLRPGAQTAIPGLALAGAWTATGWPATMEGAVRSGTAAAAAVLSLPTQRRVADVVAA